MAEGGGWGKRSEDMLAGKVAREETEGGGGEDGGGGRDGK
uniref:Uncharacterized protein n=1 Tax=Rhizophora mucronata TaxID=61149 RepID=A0A2P2QMC8_RHIMU